MRTSRAPFLAALVLAGCASVPQVHDPGNALAPAPIAQDAINWPARYKPADAGFFVHNEIEIHASPERVFDILVQAETWPTWYEGAANVTVQTADAGSLRAGSVFTWTTMDMDFTSTVKEFAPPYRLGWESRKSSIQGYHAWLIIPVDGGCRLITEESQHGFMTVLEKIFVPNKLHRLHDVWLGAVKKKAESRPAGATDA